jgi:DNA-binding protein YbaB
MPQMNALEKSVERVSTFIRALLRLAKLETGIERVAHTQVDFSALAAEVVEYVTVLAQAERITLTADIAPGIMVQGDREQLEQLITNLLSNAIKYIANERRIAVSVTAQDDKVLERAGLTCNKNAIPNDPRSPFVTSGLRFGTSAGTTRGFKEKEFEQIGNMICDVLEGFVKNGEEGNRENEERVKAEVTKLCKNFPIY